MGYIVSERLLFELKTKDYIGNDASRIPMYAEYAASFVKHFNSRGLHPILFYCNFGETTAAFIIGRKLRKAKHQVFQKHGCVFHSDMLEKLDEMFEKDAIRLNTSKLEIEISLLTNSSSDRPRCVYKESISTSKMSNEELLNKIVSNIEKAAEMLNGVEEVIVYLDETKGGINLQALRELGKPVLIVSIRKAGTQWRWEEDLLYIGLLTFRIYDYIRKRIGSNALVLKTPSSVAHLLGIHCFGMPVKVYHYDLNLSKYTHVYDASQEKMIKIQH